MPQEMTVVMKQLVEKIHANRQKMSKEIETKRAKLLSLKGLVQDFEALIRGNSTLENVAELSKLAQDAGKIIDRVVDDSDGLEKRMKRQSLNIVVAGAAGQGKSQMLQMLSGVDATLIPTGNTTICTAAQSRIINAPSQKILVHFLTEQKFLEKKIWPYYEGSGSDAEIAHLSPCPSGISDFISSPLPELPDSATPAQGEYYEALATIHASLRGNKAILGYLNGDAYEIHQKQDLKPYVTKDQNNPLYLVVDYVEIHAAFPNAIPTGTMLVDLPGLGEMTANIRENMKKTIHDEADIVFMMKLPDIHRADWLQTDIDVFDTMKTIFPAGIDYRDWLAVILNEDTRPNSCNTEQVEALLAQKRNSNRLPRVIRCDCGSTDKVAAMLAENLDDLLKKTQKIDEIWSRDFCEKYEDAKKAADALYSAALREIGSIAGTFDFKKHINEFFSDLKRPVWGSQREFFDKLSDRLKKYSDEQLDKIYSLIMEKYTAIASNDVEDEDFPIFSKKSLEERLGGHDWGEVIEKAARQQQWAIITMIRHYFKEFLSDELNQLYLSELLRKMDERGAISKVIGQKLSPEAEDLKGQFRDLQSGLCRDMQGEVVQLNSALDTLLSVEISADGNILPYLVQNASFKLFEHGDKNSDGLELLMSLIDYEKDADAFAKIVFDKFQFLTQKTFEELKCNRDINEHVCRILLANAKMFILQFYFGEVVDDEWEKLIKARASLMWPEEFERAMGNSNFGSRYKSLLQNMRNVID